jgi:hypothetical protein
MLTDIISELRQALPPVFAGTSLDELTGSAIKWSTTQNRRSRGEIPPECFVKSGKRTLIRRDPFLAWWSSTLSETTAQPFGKPRSARNRPEPPEAA